MKEDRGFKTGERGTGGVDLRLVAGGFIALVLLLSAAAFGFRARGFGLAILLLLWGALAFRPEGRVPGSRFRYRPRRRCDEGVWADPPVAELDKSTFGRLLASRLSRDPRIRVVVPRPASDPSTPAPDHGLWDRELDG